MSLIDPKKQELALYSPEQVKLIKSQVAKDATDDELKLFMLLSKTYDLDPFKKEIWFIKYNKTDVPKIFTSRDGFLKIAHNDKRFRGLMSFVVCEGDIFEIDTQNYAVIHKFGMKRGAIMGAWAKLEIDGQKPILCYVPINEYRKDTTTWKTNPSAMIQKVAESFVLRRGVDVGGLRTIEEVGIEDVPVIEKPIAKKTTKQYPIVPCPQCKTNNYTRDANGDMRCLECEYTVKNDADEELKPK
jgi:phage recombination protein Bet